MIATDLAVLTGLFWTSTYILIIRHSIQEKVVGMPMVALCMNISWEFIFSFVFPSQKPQLFINYVWFFLDLVIVTQYLKFEKFEFIENISKKFFYFVFMSTLVVSFLNILFVVKELDGIKGAEYTAFEDNLIMSMLFIQMVLSHRGVKGQSIYIAITKMIGTGCASLATYMHFPDSITLKFFYLAIFIFDFVYSILLYNRIREQGINPWARA